MSTLHVTTSEPGKVRMSTLHVTSSDPGEGTNVHTACDQ